MAHSTKTPPSLPQVVDEAPNTPSWVPALGAGLLALFLLLLAARTFMGEGELDELLEHGSDAAQEPSAVEP